uniref:Putative retrotransposon protein n=1 Tax=Phyllostachys edulis TaxID=38705 RepID=D3IVH0_PHYED|nr:putative retrotransposon protein [Phyllostachys edulis]
MTNDVLIKNSTAASSSTDSGYGYLPLITWFALLFVVVLNTETVMLAFVLLESVTVSFSRLKSCEEKYEEVLEEMTKSTMRSEEETSELIAVRQDALEAKGKAESVQQHLGELQTQVSSMQTQMNRIESLLQRLTGTPNRIPDTTVGGNIHLKRKEEIPRNPANPATIQEIDMEAMRRFKGLNPVLVSSTQGVQFNTTQGSITIRLLQDNLLHLCIGDKTPHLQWNLNPSNGMVNAFYKTISRGPKIDFPRFDGSNSLEWIRQSETYFAMANVPDEAKFDLAQMYMIRRADNWLRSTCLLWNPPPWPNFCRMICDRFAQYSGYEVLENFHSVKQYNQNISEYIDKFEELMAIYKTENPMQNEHFFVKCFVNRLRQEIKHYLKPLKPQALCEAYWMAKDMEQGAGAVARKGVHNNTFGQRKGSYSANANKSKNQNGPSVQKKGIGGTA